MLSKKFRLSSKEFQTIYKSGKKAKGEFGMLISLLSSNENPQFGFVVSKKIGNAVKRHKMTRRLRNISKEMISKYSLKNMKYQYIAFKYADNYNSLFDELERLINTKP